MKNDTEIIALRQPESVDDPLTEIARVGARRMLAAALRADADAFVAQPRCPAAGPLRSGYRPPRPPSCGPCISSAEHGVAVRSRHMMVCQSVTIRRME